MKNKYKYKYGIVGVDGAKGIFVELEDGTKVVRSEYKLFVGYPKSFFREKGKNCFRNQMRRKSQDCVFIEFNEVELLALKEGLKNAKRKLRKQMITTAIKKLFKKEGGSKNVRRRTKN